MKKINILSYHIIISYHHIQGVPDMNRKIYRGDRGGRDEQKIIREGGLKCIPEKIFTKYWFFGLYYEKNISKIRIAF